MTEKRKIRRERKNEYQIVKPLKEYDKGSILNGRDGWQRFGKQYNIRGLASLLIENNTKNKGRIRYIGSVKIAQELKEYYRERAKERKAYDILSPISSKLKMI